MAPGGMFPTVDESSHVCEWRDTAGMPAWPACLPACCREEHQPAHVRGLCDGVGVGEGGVVKGREGGWYRSSGPWMTKEEHSFSPFSTLFLLCLSSFSVCPPPLSSSFSVCPLPPPSVLLLPLSWKERDLGHVTLNLLPYLLPVVLFI